MAEELRELLARADLPAPYVLVGHSFGGTIVRVFAHRYPADVAAVVLLDGAHEDQFVRAPEALRAYTARTATMMPLVFGFLGGLVRLGVVALRPSLVPALGPLPAGAVRKVRAQVAGDPKVLRAMTDEMAQVEAGNDRVRALGIRSLGDLPIRVISHGRAEGVPAELGPELAAEYEELWQELQVAQASLSSRGSRTIADGVGHNIPWEAPGLVVDTVRGLLADAAPRRRGASPPERPLPTPASS
jgi:pimeloyl-ACP methyl ester carboxylesterase